MTIGWKAVDAMVHNWANRLGFDPHDVEWRIRRCDDGRFVMTVGVDSESGLAVVPFRAELRGPNEFAVEEALFSFRKRINPGAIDENEAA